jgi:hypothetical protein
MIGSEHTRVSRSLFLRGNEGRVRRARVSSIRPVRSSRLDCRRIATPVGGPKAYFSEKGLFLEIRQQGFQACRADVFHLVKVAYIFHLLCKISLLNSFLTLFIPLLSKEIHLLVKESFTFIYSDDPGDC